MTLFMQARGAIVGAVLLASALQVAGQARAQGVIVELRGRDGTVSGNLERIGPAGILVKPDDTTQTRSKWIGWDRVRLIRGDRAAEAAPFKELADELWRARTRLERGDVFLAEPDIERLAATYAGAGGPTGTLLGELSLRLRVLRGSQTGATMAFLRWSAVRRAGETAQAVWVGGASMLAPAVDWTMGLAVQCPPVFGPAISNAAMEAFVTSGDWDRLGVADAATRDLAMLYRVAAAGEIELRKGAEPAPPVEVKSNDPGVLLVRDIVVARLGTPEQRRAARDALERRLLTKTAAVRSGDATGGNEVASPENRWQEAWCRAGIGRSLLRETDTRDRRRGVVQLLHLPARFASDQLLLAPTALQEASDALRALGDPAGAARLIDEIRRLFPAVAPDAPQAEPAASQHKEVSV